MRFVLPYDKGLRPAWILRMGLFLYDSLGGRELLPGTKTISLKTAPHKGVLESRLTKGFEYSDCWVEDARLVVLNAVDAKARGADICTIGTTDVPFDHAPGPVKISPEETSYLCDAANEYFEDDISPDDVLWSYSGVRPLYDDKSDNASAVTRDYVLDIDEFTHGAPFLSIYGGKITTSRKLAEHALQKLAPFFIKGRAKAAGEDWTETAGFPGGDIPHADFESFYRACELRYPEVDGKILWRLARAYGTRISLVLGSSGKLGKVFGAGLSESEARYLAGHEFVTRADDIMWRRSKLGLHMSETEREAFTDWFDKTLSA